MPFPSLISSTDLNNFINLYILDCWNYAEGQNICKVNNFFLLHNLAISMITCLQWYNDSLSIRYALAVYSLYIR